MAAVAKLFRSEAVDAAVSVRPVIMLDAPTSKTVIATIFFQSSFLTYLSRGLRSVLPVKR